MRFSKLLFPLLFLSALVGCGSGGVQVEGKVTKGGQPLTLAEGEAYSITMTSEDGKTSCTGTVTKDGSFTMQASNGGGVPYGKYKVAYVYYPPAAAGGATKKGPAAPMGPETKETGEVWEVSSSTKTFTLDIKK